MLGQDGFPHPKGVPMLVLAVALLLADSPKDSAVDAQELKKFAGAWAVIEHEHGGKKTPRKEILSLAVEMKGEKMTTRDGTDVKEESAVVLLDPKAKPAAIDVKITSGDDKGKVVKAIYWFDGDKVILCLAEPGKDRPKEFAAKEGTGHTLMVLLKQKVKK
jgi:uncharacterized protein (TIGR03067 family)